jgi:hypothetical protein
LEDFVQGKIEVLRHTHRPLIGDSVPLEDVLNDYRLRGYTIISVYPVTTEGWTSHTHEFIVAEPVSMADFNAINLATKGFHKEDRDALQS